MLWSDILSRTDIIGGNIRIDEDGLKFCGLISKIYLDQGIVYIKMFWMAQLCEGGRWKKVRTTSYRIDSRIVQPREYENGLIRFRIPCVGDATIYPKRLNIVNASMVEESASD